MTNTSEKNIMQLQTVLSLLETLQTLKNYQNFCYQLYLFALGYDEAGYLGTIVSGQGSTYAGNVQRLDYSYDGLGNVLTREDNSITGKNMTT